MADIASLSLEVDSSQLKQANLELKAMPQAASAAERAAQRWGTAAQTAGRSSEQLTQKVRKNIESLEFQRLQLTRSAAEQERYSALRRAGVTAESAAGLSITASVRALQAQRAANAAAAVSAKENSAAVTMVGGAFTRMLGPMAAAAAAFVGLQALWRSVMEIGDLADRAEQIGINTDQLQGYRAAALQAGIANEELDRALVKLQQSMGTAGEGNDEMIAKFEKLGVKLLDAQKQMRAPADVLPELAKGLMNVSSTTEQTALMMELFGRGGARFRTILADWAKGNQAVVESAKKLGLVASTEVIEKWDKAGDSIGIVIQKFKVFVATIGADVAIPVIDFLIKGLSIIIAQMQALYDLGRKAVASSSAAGGATSVRDLEAALQAQDEKIKNNRAASVTGSLQAQRNAIQMQLDVARAQEREAAAAGRSAASGVQTFTGPTAGVSQPVGDKAKKAGESEAEAYRKLIMSSQQYVRSKDAETAAVGRSAAESAKLKHEQDMLNKLSDIAKKTVTQLTPEYQKLAQAMADADARLAKATFMEDAKKNSEDFVSQKRIELETIGMSTEAAVAYRYVQEQINAATRAGIELKAEDTDKIRQQGEAMGKVAAATERATQIYELERDVFKGLFTDTISNLRQGQNAWDAFGNAGLSALNKIADKLLDMALTQIFEAAFGGAKGGAGGIGGTIVSLIGSIFGGLGSARGNVFQGARLVPFAAGGVIDRPVAFPMRSGVGIAGEAGTEGIFPLRRGRGGRLGVEGTSPRIVITLAADSQWVRAVARDESGKIVAATAPGIEDRAVEKSRSQVVPTMNNYKAEREGDYRA